MSSIRTNTAAMTALQTLNMTSRDLTTTQGRISTGYKVATAADNAAYWSIATSMRSDNSALSTVQDALGLGASTVDVAYTGLNSSIDLVDKIKSKLVAARQPGVDRTKVQSEITQLQKQLQSVADSSAFSGENWLTVDSTTASYNATKSVVSSFNRAGTTVSIGTIDIDVSNSTLFDTGAGATAVGILDTTRDATTGVKDTAAGTFAIATLDISTLTDSAADLATLDGYIKGSDQAISEMSTAASNLGAAKSRIQLQQTFVSNLSKAIDQGVSSLVDADMNQESTRLSALQVQQQLGVQSLSIANQSSQSILSLFRQ